MFFLDDLPTQEMLNTYSAMYPEMEPDKLYNVLFLLRKASYMIRDLDGFLGKFELSQTRFYILMLLDREPVKDTLTSIDLVKKLNISKAVASRTIGTLKNSGYVIEKPHDSDSRAKIISLTTEGKNKLHSVLPQYYELMNSFDISDLPTGQ